MASQNNFNTTAFISSKYYQIPDNQSPHMEKKFQTLWTSLEIAKNVIIWLKPESREKKIFQEYKIKN